MSRQGDQSENKVDGTRIVTNPDGSYDVTWPSGVHTRGQEDSQETAAAVAQGLYEDFVLGQWLKGSPGRTPGSWCCPLR